jgi:Protein of unknown function (DUF2934)
MIDPKTNLLNELRPAGVPLEEFLDILARRFASSTHNTDTNFVLYPGHVPHELRVEFSREGDLTGIFALPALSEEKLEIIRQDIKTEFLETAEIGIGRQVFFSFYPVRGWWRYRDRLQILPVPPQAPTLPSPYGKHPFLIEYTYRKANSGSVNVSRGFREASKLRLLLNAVLRPWVRWINSYEVGTSSHHWTRVSDDPGNWEVKYLEEYYTCEGISSLDLFSSVETLLKISEVSPEEYYGKRHIPTGEPLDLPSDLAFTLDMFLALDSLLQDRFLHACYWLSQANLTTSFSLMLLAAVLALESLIQKPKGGKRCPNCGLMMGISTTKLFNTFLEVFLPASTKAEKGWQSIYGVRSGITHGSSPLLSDVGASFAAMNPREIEQREAVGDALQVARMCLRNWLNCEPFIHQHVAEAAYFLWQKNGCQQGHETDDWSQAITDLQVLSFLTV